jgi:hypothetical protein
MGVDFSAMVYLFCYDFYARPIIVAPLASQPGTGSYMARGIWNSDGIEVPSEAGSLISDQRTICDIKEDEFPILPVQGDQIFFPVDDNGPANGPFEITDLWTNAGGETTMALKRALPATPLPPVTPMPALPKPEPPKEEAKPGKDRRNVPWAPI